MNEYIYIYLNEYIYNYIHIRGENHPQQMSNSILRSHPNNLVFNSGTGVGLLVNCDILVDCLMV